MVTEELIKKEYIRRILSRDANFIYNTQASVIRQNFNSEGTTRLANFLAKHPYSIEGNGLHVVYSFQILTYLRFLDIKYSRQQSGIRQRLALYNRVVWGRLYHETINDLRYGLTQDIKNQISGELQRFSTD
jgi:hypothetical protein